MALAANRQLRACGRCSVNRSLHCSLHHSQRVSNSSESASLHSCARSTECRHTRRLHLPAASFVHKFVRLFFCSCVLLPASAAHPLRRGKKKEKKKRKRKSARANVPNLPPRIAPPASSLSSLARCLSMLLSPLCTWLHSPRCPLHCRSLSKPPLVLPSPHGSVRLSSPWRMHSAYDVPSSASWSTPLIHCMLPLRGQLQLDRSRMHSDANAPSCAFSTFCSFETDHNVPTRKAEAAATRRKRDEEWGGQSGKAHWHARCASHERAR